MSNNYRHIVQGLTLGLVTYVALSISIQPVSATQFKKLIETGQTPPGTDKPIATISEASIGRDGQAVINIQTPFVPGPSGGRSGSQFFGIYSITKGGKISLLSQGSKVVDISGNIDSKELLSPSISGGVISYVTYNLYEPSRMLGQIYTAKGFLNVGVPGSVTDYGSILDRKSVV